MKKSVQKTARFGEKFLTYYSVSTGPVRAINDQLHREDGPAVIWQDGSKEWWLHDNRLSFDEWLEETTGLTDEGKLMFKLEHG
jgi:hypothetical protein